MIGWIDAGAGASGDMLLGALIGAGADERFMATAVTAVSPEPVTMHTETVTRASIAATRVHVETARSHSRRGLSDILGLIAAAARTAGLDSAVAGHASAVFRLLGEAEAEVHGTSPERIHFHEVGALDAIADVVGVCAGFMSLRLDAVYAGAVAVGAGTVSTVHGTLPVPPPAVARLLIGVPTFAGPAAFESCTPTGAALLRHWVSQWRPQPMMTVQRVGTGAGSRDAATHPNCLRLFVGARADRGADDDEVLVLLETNIDDLDPRLLPAVLQRLLEHGALDAWLTPILMKKGRSAHTLSVLARPSTLDTLRAVVFEETTAIGVRTSPVHRRALARDTAHVQIDGHPVAVKLALVGGTVVNVQPEYDDVAAVATLTGRPAKAVLAEAICAANDYWDVVRRVDGSSGSVNAPD